ncbi:uncharacterized protein PB18E9.04c-like [Thrips palmi]|uniref:Uncharacterized protein PB18E9.04c-like n=1 Tax=Thrips palmi TaxID=161013 RepID=A0A6P8Z8W9_THRPL|nr:uncharacterized protein PB18E9.04c-like [Thrips palmi]
MLRPDAATLPPPLPLSAEDLADATTPSQPAKVAHHRFKPITSPTLPPPPTTPFVRSFVPRSKATRSPPELDAEAKRDRYKVSASVLANKDRFKLGRPTPSTATTATSGENVDERTNEALDVADSLPAASSSTSTVAVAEDSAETSSTETSPASSSTPSASPPPSTASSDEPSSTRTPLIRPRPAYFGQSATAVPRHRFSSRIKNTDYILAAVALPPAPRGRDFDDEDSTEETTATTEFQQV